MDELYLRNKTLEEIGLQFCLEEDIPTYHGLSGYVCYYEKTDEYYETFSGNYLDFIQLLEWYKITTSEYLNTLSEVTGMEKKLKNRSTVIKKILSNG